jgi:hypothetical protein
VADLVDPLYHWYGWSNGALMTIENLLVKYNPVLPKKWLLVIAGVMWTCVGVMLLGYAVTWLTTPPTLITGLLGAFGIVISILANRFEFSKLAKKNVARILALNDKPCLFSFQAWKGYLIIVVMITAGILLKSSSIPKPYLAVVYAAIGGALLQASVNYYLSFYKVARP